MSGLWSGEVSHVAYSPDRKSNGRFLMSSHRCITFLICLVLFVCFAVGPACAVPTIRLYSSRSAVLSDGKDSCEVVADVCDATGRTITDGTEVAFSTSLGLFAQSGTSASAYTRSGNARVRISSPQKGTATITATVSGGGFARCEVVFTDDPSETFQGNSYVVVRGDGALMYAAGERIIEAIGRSAGESEEEGKKREPGASVRYRNISVVADRLQVDCSGNVVRAWGNATLTRGKRKLACDRLFYQLMNGKGYAVASIDGHMRPVSLSGVTLKADVMDMPVAPKFLEMADITDARLMVTAREVLLFPGEKLQFKRPRFYQDGQALFSMPFYSLGLFSTQLFSDQFVSVGTQGVGVDLPLYYNMTPGSTGVVRLREGERSGSVYATRPGVSLDLTQAYNSLGGERRYSGEMDVTGFNKSDWGVRWVHSQEFSQETRGSVFLDFPQHRGVYASSNLNNQLGPIMLGTNLSANRVFSGYRSTGLDGSVYAETTPRRVGKTGYMYAIGGDLSASRTSTSAYVTSEFTRGTHIRFYSNSFRLDKLTSVSNTVSLGHVWSQKGEGGTSLMSSLSASRSVGRSSTLQATYDFTKLPTSTATTGNHRMSLSYFAGGGTKWNLYLYDSFLLDAPYSNTVGDLSYLFARRWRLTASANLQKFSGSEYRDYTLGVAWNIGGRDVVLSYSTMNHRMYFDLEASQF